MYSSRGQGQPQFVSVWDITWLVDSLLPKRRRKWWLKSLSIPREWLTWFDLASYCLWQSVSPLVYVLFSVPTFSRSDGVAPRAKMNQQRSRRFRAAQDAKDKEEARKESLKIWEGMSAWSVPMTADMGFLAMGKEVPQDEQKQAWDSNAITPGTPFMDLLASSLRYWIVHKINMDSSWNNVSSNGFWGYLFFITNLE